MKALFKLLKLFALLNGAESDSFFAALRERIAASGNFLSPKVELKQGVGAFAKENFLKYLYQAGN